MREMDTIFLCTVFVVNFVEGEHTSVVAPNCTDLRLEGDEEMAFLGDSLPLLLFEEEDDLTLMEVPSEPTTMAVLSPSSSSSSKSPLRKLKMRNRIIEMLLAFPKKSEFVFPLWWNHNCNKEKTFCGKRSNIVLLLK